MKLLLLVALLGAAAVDAPSWWCGYLGWFCAPDVDDSTPEAEWDGLRVTFGLNPFRKNFDRLPRTREMAEEKGWTPFGQENCTAGTWRGFRYVKDNDPVVILLFDTNGYIAGMQMGLYKRELPDDYPLMQITPPWIEDADMDMFLLTAYFIQPDRICNGRSEGEYQTEGTGTDLFIQTGRNLTTDLLTLPHREADLEGTDWTEGKCVKGMGKHYWWNLREDMDCDEFYPVFTMYNDGRLNVFGWRVISSSPSSPRFERGPVWLNEYIMDPVPTCLYEQEDTGVVMHVYLTSGYPLFYNRC